MSLISTFLSTITVRMASDIFFFSCGLPSFHGSRDTFAVLALAVTCSVHQVTLQQVNASASTSEGAGWRPLARAALF